MEKEDDGDGDGDDDEKDDDDPDKKKWELWDALGRRRELILSVLKAAVHPTHPHPL